MIDSKLAEREGFEPSIEFPLYTLSKRAPSTTRPSLRSELQRSIQNSTQPYSTRNVRRDPSAPPTYTRSVAFIKSVDSAFGISMNFCGLRSVSGNQLLWI